jgi:hypothetical protein
MLAAIARHVVLTYSLAQDTVTTIGRRNAKPVITAPPIKRRGTCVQSHEEK